MAERIIQTSFSDIKGWHRCYRLSRSRSDEFQPEELVKEIEWIDSTFIGHYILDGPLIWFRSENDKVMYDLIWNY